MKSNSIEVADSMFEIIKHMSEDVKVELVRKINESLKTEPQDFTKDSWRQFFGAWKSEESAEEIIEVIRASRHSNRQIEGL